VIAHSRSASREAQTARHRTLGCGGPCHRHPFLRQANEQFDVTLLAKPFARDMRARFWPCIEVIPFSAPWTAFNGKYHLLTWPWRDLISVGIRLRREKFDVALSARWDPRDHFLLRLIGAKARLGFPRTGSQMFLTHPLAVADSKSHRYENWRIIAQALHLPSEPREQLEFPPSHQSRLILVHTGAAQAVRIWPLERYLQIVNKLRALGHAVRVVCNPEQLAWWKNAGESAASAPASIVELLKILDTARVFLGNDSGPGHLAAACGVRPLRCSVRNCRMVRAVASGGGIRGRQALSLQTLFRLLPIPDAALPVEHQRGGSLAPLD